MAAKYVRIFVPVVLLVFVLAGCSTTGGPGPKATVGGLGGAAVGGLLAAGLGANAAGIAASTLLGGLVGGAIGDRMDAADRKQAQKAALSALESAPSGTSVAWQNPDSGNYGTVTPTSTYQKASGEYCREYQQKIVIGGETQQGHGTACRQPDGSWKVVN